MPSNVIYGINGPVVTVHDTDDFFMLEMVKVGNAGLIGEVININDQYTTLQIYEDTTGLHPGEPVIGTGMPMSVTLGPGLLSNIFDGIERPLGDIFKRDGAWLDKGVDLPILNAEKQWDVRIKVAVGDDLTGGMIYATCPETPAIEHRVLCPSSLSGEVTYVAPDGFYTINDVLARVRTDKGEEHELTLCQKWPIRKSRPISERFPITRPLVTGQRVIDTLFPVAKGGAAAIPGGFGTGKTMTQHQLAKWCDADIIVYVGCGERGNEMTQVLEEFGELIDPKSGRPMTDRTILIANTSNMPVAAREASIYTGITLAEYYRDMGYHVAIMADSTSRWAEALREISGRLEEMPAEEGYPAYLSSRLSEFYERSGYVKTLCGEEGSVTIIGAVSPQGGDFSEPVTQNTKRYIRTFWALDKSLAYSRHYPAINWITSYSEYDAELADWYVENVAPDFAEMRDRAAALLSEENNLMEIVKLIGADVLPDDQKLIIETARILRIGFLQQNAFHDIDTYVPMIKQYHMLRAILHFYTEAHQLVAEAVPLARLLETGLPERLIKMKFDVTNDHPEKIEEYIEEINRQTAEILEKNKTKS